MLIFNRAINKKTPQSLTTEAVEDIHISPYQGSMKNAYKKITALHSAKTLDSAKNVIFCSSCVLFQNNTCDLYSVQNIAAWFFLMFYIFRLIFLYLEINKGHS